VPARRDSLPLSFPRWKTYDPWRKEENLPGKPHFKGQSGKKWRVADPYWPPEDREVDVTTFVCVFVCSCIRTRRRTTTCSRRKARALHTKHALHSVCVHDAHSSTKFIAFAH
jgi:hypothetical protein